MLAQQLGKLPNDLLIEGHTDSKPFDEARDYSNWELSTDRANAARRMMEASGLREGQVDAGARIRRSESARQGAS